MDFHAFFRAQHFCIGSLQSLAHIPVPTHLGTTFLLAPLANRSGLLQTHFRQETQAEHVLG